MPLFLLRFLPSTDTASLYFRKIYDCLQVWILEVLDGCVQRGTLENVVRFVGYLWKANIWCIVWINKPEIRDYMTTASEILHCRILNKSVLLV